MNSTQKKKILVLVVFVAILIASAIYMFNSMVKPSPYYQNPKKEAVDE